MKQMPERTYLPDKKPKQLYHRKQEPTIAPGLEDDKLHENATQQEVQAGDSTSVTQLSWDEHDNGSDD